MDKKLLASRPAAARLVTAEFRCARVAPRQEGRASASNSTRNTEEMLEKL